MISNRCARKSLVTNCNSIISKNYLRFLVDSNVYRYNLLFFYERPTNQIIRVTVISGKSCKNISNNPSSFILLAFTTILM